MRPWINRALPAPPDHRVLVEGLPGVGKSWITKTLRNITHQMHQYNTADMASTPTGCSAALVDGKTHYCAMFLTPGTHFLQTPTSMAETQRQKILEARIRMANIVAWFMDEHSMTGREMWAWLHDHSQELRRPLPTVIPWVTDRDQEDVLAGVEGGIPVPNIPRKPILQYMNVRGEAFHSFTHLGIVTSLLQLVQDPSALP